MKDCPPACSIKNDIGKTSYRTLHKTVQFSQQLIFKVLSILDMLFRPKVNAEVEHDIPKFSIWTFFVSRVQKDASIKQRTMNISYHAVHVYRCHNLEEKKKVKLGHSVATFKCSRQ